MASLGAFRSTLRALGLSLCLMHPSQITKLVNANVRAAVLFGVMFFLFFPVDIWRALTTPFDGED
jgi:hypothetical protein